MIVRSEGGQYYKLDPISEHEANEQRSVELFSLLLSSLHCRPLLEDGFWRKYTIHAGEDGNLHVYEKDGDKLFDERGSLYLALVDIGSDLIPNWENRL